MMTGTYWRRRLLGFEFVTGFVLTGGMVALVLLSDVLFPDGGSAMDLTARLQPPGQSLAHILGTDPLGRDVLARVVVGGQVSLTVGVVSVLGAVIVGIAAGLIAGYYRGVWDIVLMRWADVQLAPSPPFWGPICGGSSPSWRSRNGCNMPGSYAARCCRCANGNMCNPLARSALVTSPSSGAISCPRDRPGHHPDDPERRQ
jgi:hypothetical protein